MVIGLAVAVGGCAGDPFTSMSTNIGGSTGTGGTAGHGGGAVTAVAGAGGGNTGSGNAGGAALAGGAGSGSAVAGAAGEPDLGEAGAPDPGTGGNAGAGMGAGGGGAGGGAAALVGVFVAQGYEGRITRSCDDGRTFPFNHSADDQFHCFADEQHNCDESEVAGRGLAFGAGSFVATWGYNRPGKLQRSTDGKEWTDVMTGTPPFEGVAYGNSVFVADGNPPSVSSDGKTWSRGGKLSFDFDYRGIEFVPTAGGTFVVTGDSADQKAISLSRDGKVWKAASKLPAQCIQDVCTIAGSPSVMIVSSEQGHICWSADGDAWTYVAVADRFTSRPIWTGTEFWIYSGAELFKSADAQSWSSVTIEPANIEIGALARSPGGTLVATNAGWDVWYGEQHFFRSTDGVHWDVLPKTAFTGSHPITFIGFGRVPASAGCGLP